MATNAQSSEKLFRIPIYDCVLRVIVARDLPAARRKYDHLFGKFDGANYDGLCSWSGGHNFALFFTPLASRKTETIAHEVFHVTHRILEWSGSKFDTEHHESGALLCGYLMKLVTGALKGRKGARA